MEKCSKCGFPSTRPGLIFENGVCGACINYEKRKGIDWAARKEELKKICDSTRKKSGYDCIIAVSGGKDSYFITHTLVTEMNMHPLLVTVTDPFTHTKAGMHNLRNLIEKFNLNHITYTISHDLFKRATRWAFEQNGESLKFVEYAIYTIPVILAKKYKIPLVFFGENSAYEYGTTFEDNYRANPAITQMAKQLLADIGWWIDGGVGEEEVMSIVPEMPLDDYVDVLYMSHFVPWSSVANLEVAKRYGFKTLEGEWDREGVIEDFEQIDSVAYMFFLWTKHPKFGFQRVTDIATRRVREGLLSKEEAEKLIKEKDFRCDPKARADFRDTLGYEDWEVDAIVARHRKY